jgi:hypothetical protein
LVNESFKKQTKQQPKHQLPPSLINRLPRYFFVDIHDL